VETLIPITFFLSVAGVLILRPVTRQLGGLLEAMTRDRSALRADDAQAARMATLMEHMSRRMDAIEERLDFTERLLSAPDRRRIPRQSDRASIPGS
jgi:hypothetical protein